MGIGPQGCPPQLVQGTGDHGRTSSDFGGKQHWCPALTHSHPLPGSCPFPLASKASHHKSLKLVEDLSGHQCLFCLLANQVGKSQAIKAFGNSLSFLGLLAKIKCGNSLREISGGA